MECVVLKHFRLSLDGVTNTPFSPNRDKLQDVPADVETLNSLELEGYIERPGLTKLRIETPTDPKPEPHQPGPITPAPQVPVPETPGMTMDPSTLQEPTEIPEDWEALDWQTLRKLALEFDPEVVNKEQAIAAVEAEIARREEGMIVPAPAAASQG